MLTFIPTPVFAVSRNLFTRLFTVFALLAVTCLLSSCASLIAGPREMTIPLARLQENLDKRFPLSHRALEMFDVRLQSPKLTLLPEENRVQARLDAVVSPPLTSKTWRGSLSVSGTLYYDAERRAIFWREPRLEDFSVEGTDAAYKRQYGKVGGMLLDKVTADIAVYTFEPEQLKKFGTEFTIVKISTRADALVVSFEPLRK